MVDWNVVAALAAVAAALAAIAALVAESKRSRFAQSVELLLRFEDRFASPEFLGIRKRAVEGLAAGNAGECDDVLDFFETIGLLVKKGALDPQMVWSSFSYWLLHYTVAASEYISKARSADPALWGYLIFLQNIVREIESDEGGKLAAKPTLDGTEAFLKEEMSIAISI